MIIRYPSPPFVAAPCLSDQKQPLPRNIWSTHLHQQEVPEQRIKVEQSDQSTLAIRSSVRRGKTWRRAKRENVKGWNDLIPMWSSTKATHGPNWISNVEANIHWKVYRGSYFLWNLMKFHTINFHSFEHQMWRTQIFLARKVWTWKIYFRFCEDWHERMEPPEQNVTQSAYQPDFPKRFRRIPSMFHLHSTVQSQCSVFSVYDGTQTDPQTEYWQNRRRR